MSGQWRVIGIKDEDPAPLDAKAVGRHPYIIRAAVLVEDANPEDEDDILRQLSTLPIPDKPGPADLPVYGFHPPEVPLVPIRVPGVAGFAYKSMTKYGLWLLVGVMVTVEVLLFTSASEPSISAILLRLGLLILVVAIFSGIRKPWPKQKDLGNLEWQWYGRVRPKQEILGFAARGARIIKADGSNWELSVPRPIHELGIARDPDSAVTYDARIYVRPGLLILSGKERIINNGASWPVAFSRVYVWRRATWPFRGGWFLDFAQWTSLDARPTTASGRDEKHRASEKDDSAKNKSLQQSGSA